ncbi:DinB family protein [Plantactinospora sp. GCM10030261]|uniref:DinB family protein n=1 Tax=Plantactinospora sp. GCM10030261 TaxID=3273420 RepID=UPI003623070A
MTWIAPEVSRPAGIYAGDERTTLDNFLDWHRHSLLAKCAGLTAEQLKIASVEPSNLTLLGLVRHMAYVERVWFRERFAGEDVPRLFETEERGDIDFEDVAEADAEADFALFHAELDAARAAVAGRSLDETFVLRRRDGSVNETSLRWVYIHMIEEYAQHLGHADLIRERIDGVTGN